MDEDLRDTLEKLHQELEKTENLDEESRQRLAHLMGDIRTVLDRQEQASADENQSLGDQIIEAIERYEVSYPNLALALRHALDILSGSGI